MTAATLAILPYVNAGAAGLDEEGYAQRWLELNPEDTVIMRDGTTRPRP